MPRKPSCACGECTLCKRRIAARARYQALTIEERRAWIARRDPQKVRANDNARYLRDKAKRQAANRKYVAEHREAVRQYQALWLKNNHEKMRASQAAWAERNPEKRAAHVIVGHAVQSGLLTKQPCEIGDNCEGIINAHHDDYSEPLAVRWLCRKHHLAEHKDQCRRAASRA